MVRVFGVKIEKRSLLNKRFKFESYKTHSFMKQSTFSNKKRKMIFWPILLYALSVTPQVVVSSNSNLRTRSLVEDDEPMNMTLEDEHMNMTISEFAKKE